MAPDEPFKRLFFALPCSPQRGKAISRWRRGLGLRGGRPVPVENFHLTLMFLGEVGVGQLPVILDTAARLRPLAQPVNLWLDQVEVWRRSQALVLTSKEVPSAFLHWVYALQQAMLPLGFDTDSRDFRPHLTLMRDYRDPVPEVAPDTEFSLPGREFVLFESSKGRYLPLAHWSLIAE